MIDLEEYHAVVSMCRHILIDFTRWGIAKGDEFTDITINDLDQYSEEWVIENFKEDEPIQSLIERQTPIVRDI